MYSDLMAQVQMFHKYLRGESYLYSELGYASCLPCFTGLLIQTMQISAVVETHKTGFWKTGAFITLLLVGY